MGDRPKLIIKAASGAATEPSRAFSNGPGVGPGAMTRYAPINKLRARLRAGLGEAQVEQLALQRMQRMTSETAEPPRHVVTIQDVTRGLGIAVVDEQRIQKAVESTNVEFTPKTQTQRIFLARGALNTLLRSMDSLNGDQRLEVTKRATAWWKKSVDTDLNRSRTVHFISFPQGHMQKGGKVERWITVNGARIPIINGEMHGPIADKIRERRKKKRKDAAVRAVSGGYEGTKPKSVRPLPDEPEWMKRNRARHQRGGEDTKPTKNEKSFPVEPLPDEPEWMKRNRARSDKVKKSLAYSPPARRKKIDLEWK